MIVRKIGVACRSSKIYVLSTHIAFSIEKLERRRSSEGDYYCIRERKLDVDQLTAYGDMASTLISQLYETKMSGSWIALDKT